jgi:rod shape-determining protein MreC
VLLFPIRKAADIWQFLLISHDRITELEKTISELQLENTELRRKILLDTTELTTTAFRALRTKIIGRDPANINGFLLIDKGEREKLYINQPVVSVAGLVGRIKYVGTACSIVETIDNRGFAVSAFDSKTGVHGIVKQRGSLFFDFIKMRDEVHIGDSIITSGMSNIFPEGILIGTVSKISTDHDLFFKPIQITPSANVNQLLSVYVIFGSDTSRPMTIPLKNARSAAEEPTR